MFSFFFLSLFHHLLECHFHKFSSFEALHLLLNSQHTHTLTRSSCGYMTQKRPELLSFSILSHYTSLYGTFHDFRLEFIMNCITHSLFSNEIYLYSKATFARDLLFQCLFASLGCFKSGGSILNLLWLFFLFKCFNFMSLSTVST